jgi:Uma2 family endonuclease
MNLIALPSGGLTSLPPLPIYRFSVDQYHRMIAAGILGDEDPVELLAGLIVIKGNSTLAPAISVCSDAAGNGHQYPPVPVRRFTVHEFHRLMQDGILPEEERVELVEGWIIRSITRNPAHDVVIALVLAALGLKLPSNWHCRGQSAITTDVSEPEPDVAVVRGTPRDYLQGHPRPRGIGMLVEVADTTPLSDRNLKGPSYARVSIPVYWIVNLQDTLVEVYTDPSGPDPDPCYRQRRDYGITEEVPLVLDGQEVGRIPVRDLLP